MPFNHTHELYWTYANMKARCYNTRHRRYKDWGGRGIRVCERWLERVTGFSNFVADMGERPRGHQLDRKDNDGDYSPENCRWTTVIKQSQNRRLRNTNKFGVNGIEVRPGNIFVARITINKKRINLGSFKTLEKAIEARLKAEKVYFHANTA